MTFAAQLKSCWDKCSVELSRWIIPSMGGSSVREREDGRACAGREGEATLIERKREMGREEGANGGGLRGGARTVLSGSAR